MPKRIQLKRTKGWKMPEGTVNVARPSVFGNPFKVTDEFPAAAAVGAFRLWLLLQPNFTTPAVSRRATLLQRLPELRGKDLACWCAEGSPCHADVLLELANA